MRKALSSTRRTKASSFLKSRSSAPLIFTISAWPLETHIVRKLSACILTGEQIERVQANLDEQKFHMRKFDYEAFTRADLEFHLLLARFHENLEMIHAIDRLQNQLFRIALNVMRKDRNRMQVSYEDHVSVFEHIRNGNAAGAGETMMRHLEFGKQILVM
jgi:Transcriptional regulators